MSRKGNKVQMHRSFEDYLKTIYLKNQRTGEGVRGADLAELLHVARPTVSVAAKHLVEDGYAVRDANRALFLTEKGKKIAEGIFDRHRVVSLLLEGIGVPPEIAHRDACRMEHSISDETLQAFHRHLEKTGCSEK